MVSPPDRAEGRAPTGLSSKSVGRPADPRRSSAEALIERRAHEADRERFQERDNGVFVLVTQLKITQLPGVDVSGIFGRHDSSSSRRLRW